jgi:hypothetical protein
MLTDRNSSRCTQVKFEQPLVILQTPSVAHRLTDLSDELASIANAMKPRQAAPAMKLYRFIVAYSNLLLELQEVFIPRE